MNNPSNTVTQLFVATDQGNWDEVAQCFHSNVLLDYSSMNGSPASELSPQQIVSSWKSILPGFDFTHHQIGNVLSNVEGNKANVFCYGTASHFLKYEDGNIWTVVGSYDFELVKNNDASWKISSMKFNFKYQDGNEKLPEMAINKLK